MKKTTKKAFLMLAMSVLLLPCLFFAASAEGADAAQITDASFESVILNVGADETRRNITWYSQYDTTGEVRYAKANDLQNGALPENYLSAEARISKTSKSGYYFYKASMWGLEANTTYAYCLVTGNSVGHYYLVGVAKVRLS